MKDPALTSASYFTFTYARFYGMGNFAAAK